MDAVVFGAHKAVDLTLTQQVDMGIFNIEEVGALDTIERTRGIGILLDNLLFGVPCRILNGIAVLADDDMTCTLTSIA